ncbi:MAG: hypothetical protein ACI4S2_09335 [Lachnospiraceae bacterium]
MNLKKIGILLFSLTLFCTVTCCTEVNASTDSNTIISNSSETSISPYTDNIGWRYKTVNGVLYKRKYNYTTKQWIGDWIKA